MAVVVSSEDVLLIIDTDLEEPQVNDMIRTALRLVDEHISSTEASEGLRSEIVKYLAAHFIAIVDPRTKEESADGVRTVFLNKVGTGLDATMYGQQVKMLDPTGKLSKIGSDGIRKKLAYHLSNDQVD